MNGRRRKPDTRTRVGGRRRDTAGERARGREKALYAGQLIDARAQRRVRVEWRVRVRGCQVRFVNGARGVPGHLNLACLPSLPTPESSPDSIARIPLSLSLLLSRVSRWVVAIHDGSSNIDPSTYPQIWDLKRTTFRILCIN